LNKSIKRAVSFVIFVALIFVLYGARLVYLQLICGESYLEKSQKSVLRSATVIAPRGEIVDRLGRPLVSNRIGYTVTLEKDMMEDINATLKRLVEVLDENGDVFEDNFPITLNEPYDFLEYNTENKGVLSSSFKAYLKKRKINIESTPQEIVTQLKSYYELNDYDELMARKIIGIRCELDLGGYAATGYILANDISINSVTKIKEDYENFKGISVDTTPIREYDQADIAAHILGRVGMIYAEEYPALKAQGYSLNDQVGKDGIENTCEKYLKGINGLKQVEKNTSGQITSIIESKQAIPGNNVILTIDSDLQRVAEKALEKRINEIKEEAYTVYGRDGMGADVQGGAVVVVEVNTGEILALANYPTYKLETYNKDFSENINNPLKPLLNRGISGTYPPGSTFKMLTGIAGLEEKVVNINTTYSCYGSYTYYADAGYSPRCYAGMAHGTNAIDGAIRHSCNGYFFDIGRLIGIDKLNQWTKLFGFGAKTGIELPGEAEGIIASRQYSEEVLDRIWTAGNTIQAAIGQSDNMFTPIQLAGYVQTIASEGKRYKLHIVKSVKSYHYDKIILENTPELVENIELSKDTVSSVKKGMERVMLETSIAWRFADLGIKVAGKTGTAQVPKGSANGTFVCYAPADDPQIAIAVVVEHAGEGGLISPIAKDILASYFSVKETGDTIDRESVLIS